jgi:predicted phosphoribosyltransferase
MKRAPLYRDRGDAGRQLADRLDGLAGRDDIVVVGLPRGGVPVASEVARQLDAPLDVFLVRKVGFPGHEELAIGAVASGGVRVLNDEVIDHYELPAGVVETATARALDELAGRERDLRGDRPPLAISGRAAIVVDDGLATGMTMRAALLALRAQGARALLVAVPVASTDACELVAREADALVCDATPEPFRAVGAWYGDFDQVSDSDVRELLARGSR